MKYIYSTSQISKLSLTLHTFSVTGSVAGLFLTVIYSEDISQVESYNWKYQLILTSPAFPRLLELSKTYSKVIMDTNNAYTMKLKQLSSRTIQIRVLFLLLFTCSLYISLKIQRIELKSKIIWKLSKVSQAHDCLFIRNLTSI